MEFVLLKLDLGAIGGGMMVLLTPIPSNVALYLSFISLGITSLYVFDPNMVCLKKQHCKHSPQWFYHQ